MFCKSIIFHHKGFTLAEVLITLGIIGVVAAMTIPTLMQKTQDAEFKTAAKKAFSVASAAVEKMRDDEGGDLSYYVNTPYSFKPVYMKYFKVLKDCGNYDCANTYTQSSSIYKSLSNTNGDTGWISYGQFITTDGMLWMFENDPSGLAIFVDVNGYNKKPNMFGRDVFAFQVIDNTLVPMGSPKTYFRAPESCDSSINSAMQGFGCMYNVMQGIDY